MLSIVTGASRGIGFETVKELAKNPKNLVLAVSRNPASLEQFIKKKNILNILAVKADIGKEKGINQVVKIVKQLQLPVNALINNAGLLIKKPVEKLNLNDLQLIYHTNVFTPFMLSKSLIHFFAKKAHIVNIGSMGGVQGSAKFVGLSAYSSSKGALAILSECLAEELKEKNISVNCLALGSVQTEMLSAAFPGYKAPVGAQTMATFISDFASNGHQFFNGKILPVSSSTP